MFVLSVKNDKIYYKDKEISYELLSLIIKDEAEALSCDKCEIRVLKIF